MAVNRLRKDPAYGLNNPLQGLAPQPIVAQRDPVAADQAELGTLWVNEASNAYFILTSAGNWQAQQTGSGTFASVSVTGTVGDVLTVAAGGDTNLGGDLAIAGNTAMTGDLTVDGNLVANGDFDITSASAISLTSTDNAPQAIYLHANGGAAETIEIHADQGTGLNSVYVLSDVGGVLVEAAGKADSQAINLLADAGGVQFDAVLTSAWNVVGAGEDIQLNATGGSIAATATEATAGAITLSASDAAGTILLNGVGGITAQSTNAPIAVTSGTGAISISADAASTTVNLATGAAAKAVNIATGNTGIKTVHIADGSVANVVAIGSLTGAASLALQAGSTGITAAAANGPVAITSGTGAVSISADNTNNSINIATGGGVKALTLGSTNTTSSVLIQSGTGDVAVTSADAVTLDAVGVLELNSSGAAISIGNDAVAQNINIGTGAATRAVTIGNNTNATSVTIDGGTGGIILSAFGNVAVDPDTISGASTTPTLDARVGVVTVTGLTTAMNATQVITISNSNVTTSSGILASAYNLDASTNGAAIGIASIVGAAGSMAITIINNGAGALGAGDNVVISFWVIS